MVSLFFVGITLAEFAALILLKEHLQKASISKRLSKCTCGKLTPIEVSSASLQSKENHIVGKGLVGGKAIPMEVTSDSFQSKANPIEGRSAINNSSLDTSTTDSLIKSIDNAICIIFLSAYLVFNCVYWVYYLSKN